jgi:hypothetical protein
MSLVAISGNASGTGTLTIAAPNTNSNFTLTLPQNTGTLISTKSAGTVLQVLQGTYSTQVSSTSSSLADTGLSASITPTSSSSKVLVIVSQAMLSSSGSGNITINRAGTDVITFGYGTGINTGGSNTAFYQSFQYLDSPATTSATTYKTRFNRISGAGTVYAQYVDANGTEQSVITLMEIAA